MIDMKKIICLIAICLNVYILVANITQVKMNTPYVCNETPMYCTCYTLGDTIFCGEDTAVCVYKLTQDTIKK